MKETFDNNAKDVKYIIEERINKTIVGRNNEIECFKKQFDRVLEGGMGLSVVSGKPGIGKTFFVEYAAGLFISGNATYVYGKFRQYDKNSLVAIAEVIEQTVRHILTLPTQSLKHIKHDVIQKLGTDSAIIISICPYAEILLGAHKAIHTDSLEQLKYKVRKAVHRFLEIASTALFPLIVFIDDLQWADTLSLNVIEALCKDYEFFNLQLVLAYRDNDNGKARLNPAKLPQSGSIFIELAGLAYEDIEQYVQLVFERNIEHQDYLIRILYGLTLGHPFNINRILRLLLRESVLSYSYTNKKWLVQFDEMENLNLPADMEQLVREQIEGLKDEDKKLLELLKSVGIKCIVYGFNQDKEDGSLRFKKFNEDEFYTDLASCRSIITNGGFTLITEALYLKKPILSVPVKKQFEQILNAIYIERMGYGEFHEEITEDVLMNFLENLDQYRGKLEESDTSEGNQEILEELERTIEKYALDFD